MTRRQRKMWKRALTIVKMRQQFIETEIWRHNIIKECATMFGAAGFMLCVDASQGPMETCWAINRKLKRLTQRNEHYKELTFRQNLADVVKYITRPN